MAKKVNVDANYHLFVTNKYNGPIKVSLSIWAFNELIQYEFSSSV